MINLKDNQGTHYLHFNFDRKREINLLRIDYKTLFITEVYKSIEKQNSQRRTHQLFT
jgi:hypothetical protein